MAGIGTPPRVSPSPKAGAGRRRTPPARREKDGEANAQRPLQPAPLTPVGWDVEAAKAAGVQHPAAKAQAAPPGARDASHSPDNPNKVERLKRQQLKRSFFPSRGRGGKGKGRGKQQGAGQWVQIQPVVKKKARGRGGGPSQRLVFQRPGKGANGGGRGKAS